MGGKKCKTEEERLARKRESARKYYHANKDTLVKDEQYREHKRQASLKYYYKNQQKCIDYACSWQSENKDRVKLINKKAYYKRKYGKDIIFIKKKSIQEPKSILPIIESPGIDS